MTGSETDPRLDLVAGSVALRHGEIRFVRPRDAAALLYEEDVAADQAYPPYWAELWPSAVELAYAVSGRDWTGAAVLELGCGLGLPAIAAASRGARVLATDRAADAVTFAAVNAEQNGVAVETAVCSWDDPERMVARARGGWCSRRTCSTGSATSTRCSTCCPGWSASTVRCGSPTRAGRSPGSSSRPRGPAGARS
ncbi:hypothetical protein BJF78_31300 [Pseudonocardia sp. CNS-139]|nr:hypothetical protein BJF78_31300 [Pseudonocardia sp. CNS-139]